jgi:hypothetical protein
VKSYERDPVRLNAQLVELCDRNDLAVDPLHRLAEFVAASDNLPAKFRDQALEHVIDALSPLHVPAVREARLIGDVGAGVGFPGLVLASVLAAEVSLVELAPDRCAYLRDAARALSLVNTTVVESPVEAWAERSCDVITSRNVARLPTVVEWAAPHARVGGTIILWASFRGLDAAERADGVAAAAATGLAPASIIDANRWEGQLPGARRCLHVFRKVRETPADYPRSRKAALKRPIRAGIHP